jgi:hypothetical protein
MTRQSETQKPGYAERIAARKRLRAIIGWGARFGDLTPEQRQEVERRASEPLARASLDAVASGARPVAASFSPVPTSTLPLRFEARFRDPLRKGDKVSTVRKKSSHTARYKLGHKVRVEAPKGNIIGETIITGVEDAPRLSPAERDALAKVYGPRFNGPWVRLRFEPFVK